MASSHPWPFEDEDRPSGSVRPLSQADLQAILAHLSDDPDQLLARTGADRPVVAVRCGPAWAGRAAPPKRGGGGPGRPSGPPGLEPCPGGWPPCSASGPVGDSWAACSRPDWAWWSAAWRPPRPAGGCGSGPAPTPVPGDVVQSASGAPPACSTTWSGTGGRSCTTWPSPAARPTSTTW